jgi:hypothetical protein
MGFHFPVEMNLLAAVIFLGASFKSFYNFKESRDQGFEESSEK